MSLITGGGGGGGGKGGSYKKKIKKRVYGRKPGGPAEYDEETYKTEKTEAYGRLISRKFKSMEDILRHFVYKMYVVEDETFYTPPLVRPYKKIFITPEHAGKPREAYIAHRKTWLPDIEITTKKNRAKFILMIDISGSMYRDILGVYRSVYTILDIIINELNMKADISLYLVNSSYSRFKNFRTGELIHIDKPELPENQNDFVFRVYTERDAINFLINAFNIYDDRNCEHMAKTITKGRDYRHKLPLDMSGTDLSRHFEIATGMMKKYQYDYIMFFSDSWIFDYHKIAYTLFRNRPDILWISTDRFPDDEVAPYFNTNTRIFVPSDMFNELVVSAPFSIEWCEQ